MSSYRYSTKGNPGTMGFPYDSTRHNQYTITDKDNQPGALMDTFQVEVVRTPEPNRPGIDFDVKVMRYLAGRFKATAAGCGINASLPR